MSVKKLIIKKVILSKTARKTAKKGIMFVVPPDFFDRHRHLGKIVDMM